MPANVIDIAPIFTRISALTLSGPVRSTTRAALDGRDQRSRSRIAFQLSSIGFELENE